MSFKFLRMIQNCGKNVFSQTYARSTVEEHLIKKMANYFEKKNVLFIPRIINLAKSGQICIRFKFPLKRNLRRIGINFTIDENIFV